MVSARSDAPGSASLVFALRTLRERWWLILLTLVVCVGLALVLAERSPRRYQATATLLFGSTSENLTGALNPNASNTSADPQRDQSTTQLLVNSQSVARRVAAVLHLRNSPADLASEVQVAAVPDANLINVIATDGHPSRAAALANAFAEQYKAFRQATDRAGLAQGEKDLFAEIKRTAPSDATQRVTLEQALSQLVLLSAADSGGVQVVGLASAPTSASSPRPKRAALLAAVLGLALGIGVVFALNLFDRRIKSVGDFEALYGFHALTTVPSRARLDVWSHSAVTLEPYRILRVGLSSLLPDREPRVIMVTSAVAGEGKTTTAIGLARALVLSGKHVALVEVDLRRPTFHHRFDLRGDSRGLTNALVGDESVRDLLRTPVPELPSLMVLPGGPAVPDSAELLRDAEMTRILHELSEEADVVVLDAPPLLPVADAQGLLDVLQIDICLVIARAYQATREDVLRTRTILEAHWQRRFGLVVNGLRSQAGYEYYGPVGSQSGISPRVDDGVQSRPGA